MFLEITNDYQMPSTRLLLISLLIGLSIFPSSKAAKDSNDKNPKKVTPKKKSTYPKNKYMVGTIGAGAVGIALSSMRKGGEEIPNDSLPPTVEDQAKSSTIDFFPMLDKEDTVLRNRCISAYKYLQDARYNFKILTLDIRTIVQNNALKEEFLAFAKERDKTFNAKRYREVPKLRRKFNEFCDNSAIDSLTFSYDDTFMNTIRDDLVEACQKIERDQQSGKNSYQYKIAYYKNPIDQFKEQGLPRQITEKSLQTLHEQPLILQKMRGAFKDQEIQAIKTYRIKLSLLTDTPLKYEGHYTKDLSIAVEQVIQAIDTIDILDKSLALYTANKATLDPQIPITNLKEREKTFKQLLYKAKENYRKSQRTSR